jgi:hypothetical protein
VAKDFWNGFLLATLIAALAWPSNAHATYDWQLRLVRAVESISDAIKENTRACK